MEFVHCMSCFAPFETIDESVKTGNITPKTSTNDTTTRRRFWLTECCHILCEQHMFPSRRAQNDTGQPTETHTCPHCHAENIAIMPLTQDIPNKIAMFFKPFDEVIEDLISITKFQYTNMTSLVRHLSNTLRNQQQLLSKAKRELESLKDLKTRVTQLERENNRLKLQQELRTSNKNVQDSHSNDRDRISLKRKTPDDTNRSQSSPFFSTPTTTSRTAVALPNLRSFSYRPPPPFTSHQTAIAPPATPTSFRRPIGTPCTPSFNLHTPRQPLSAMSNNGQGAGSYSLNQRPNEYQRPAFYTPQMRPLQVPIQQQQYYSHLSRPNLSKSTSMMTNLNMNTNMNTNTNMITRPFVSSSTYTPRPHSATITRARFYSNSPSISNNNNLNTRRHSIHEPFPPPFPR